ncbi:MAG: selenide, water dikinase SelD [Phycisphaeraceae bacterium]|nr:selenide, water dikinase SelD [Phycisphaeraceae bacterium]
MFTSQGICPCAGERPDPVPAEQVRLTELVRNAGCASKIAPGDLEEILSRLPAVDDPRVLCGVAAGDDAGVYQLDGKCLVQTVDVMTPCVDDARTFGRICAANCVSDVYAMGGTPLTALSILAFPSETMSSQIMYEMLAGAMEVLAEAEVALIGGHSIKDEQIMLGFAITGTVDPQHVTERGKAAVGDVLVLTKPLGSGVLNFAKQIGRAHEAGLRQAEQSMAMLNRVASQAMTRCNATACTDITGFGLFGHLAGMVRHSKVTARIDVEHLPAFDGALALLAGNVIPGTIERNSEYVGDDLVREPGTDESHVLLGLDAQTSGGLLIAISPARVDELLNLLAEGGVSGHVIGRVSEASQGRIIAAGSGAVVSERVIARREPAPAVVPEAAGTSIAEARRSFGSLMRSTAQAGAVDQKTKALINIALVTIQRCGPCLLSHLAKARTLGIAQEQIDEAIWCAIAMGGACVKVFYDELMQSQAEADKGTGKSCC